MHYNKLICVEKHFHSKGHDFNRDAKFTIIEIIEKNADIMTIIETHEHKWINQLQTLALNRFNIAYQLHLKTFFP